MNSLMRAIEAYVVAKENLHIAAWHLSHHDAFGVVKRRIEQATQKVNDAKKQLEEELSK